MFASAFKSVEVRPEVWRAFREADRMAGTNNFVMASLLAMVLVIMGAVLDHFVYPQQAGLFLLLRFACASALAVLLTIGLQPVGRRFYRLISVCVALVPALTFGVMIFLTDGHLSTYYVALVLFLLLFGLILNWSPQQSIVAVYAVCLIYLAACIFNERQSINFGVFFNNMYFILLASAVVIFGSWVQTNARMRAFVLQHELSEKNRRLEIAFEQLRETEAELLHSEKMASLGRLAAGVIHEINNPLNYANTALYLLQKEAASLPIQKRAKIEGIIHDISDGVQRVQTIVSGLRSFSHPKAERFEHVRVADIVATAFRYVGHDRKAEVEIHCDISPEHVVWGNEQQLLQVVLNLLQNAYDAMLDEQFKPADNRKPQIQITSYEEKGNLKLKIRDNGPGIPQAIINKIFDPFFTTKDVGSGTGLGLSISYRIIKNHRGTISVESEEGIFTEFTLTLPTSPADT
ncbi:MAG: ATP-binding protein [Methylacidiphilales bacterium]|nr:ATP-binding protein [Candidatus Methylacidiphilales bacterium]MDW8349123.1 ATP-binding protein [Verrucomicrobiae bacterium]